MSSLNKSLPPVSKELLSALDAVFPLRSPRLTQSDREIWLEAGQRSVVDYLRAQFDLQNANSLGAPVLRS